MWETADTIGLISCILGSVLLGMPFGRVATAIIVWLAGGAAALIMGIAAVAKDSKIGIGGIVLGALLILIGGLSLIS